MNATTELKLMIAAFAVLFFAKFLTAEPAIFCWCNDVQFDQVVVAFAVAIQEIHL